MNNENKGYLDEFIGKLISRKFLVWIVATILVFTGALQKFVVITSHDWVLLSCVYIGGQSLIDIVQVFKGNSTTTTGTIGTFLQNVTTTNNSTSSKNIKKTKKDEKDTSNDRPKSFGGMQ